MRKQHGKVEAVKKQRQAAIDAIHRNGRPIFSDDIMAEKLAAIDAGYDAALVALMETAVMQHDAAAEKLAEVDRPYEWLTQDELTRAATLAPFVREDLGGLGASALVEAVKTATGRGRVESWLAYRYATRRAAELDADDAQRLNPLERMQFDTATNALRDVAMLPSQRKEYTTAQDALTDAQALHDAAEWARPSTRAAFASTMGVDAQYLPA